MSSLNNVGKFAILLETSDNKLIDTVRKICLKKGVPYNNVKIDEETAYILYDIEKTYMYNLGANKKLKFIWKDTDDFYIIDFKNNTKGDIISYLTFEENAGNKIEGDIEYINLKEQFKNAKKVPLISSKLINETEPFTYEHFSLYCKD